MMTHRTGKRSVKLPKHRDASWHSRPALERDLEVHEEINELVGGNFPVKQFVADLSEFFDATSAVLILRAAKKNGLL
jgi:hypothetical protein